MKLAALADHLGATLLGDPEAEIHSVASIEHAGPGQLTFVANAKYIPLARTTQATAVLVEPAFETIPAHTLRLQNPYLAFARALELFHTPLSYPPGIHPTAVIAPTATIGAHAHIGACAVVGDHVVLGDHAVLQPHVVLYPHVKVGDHFFAHAHAVVREYCQLGDHVLLQNGAIIGADGFGFARRSSVPPGSPAFHKIPQTGPTILEDHVEVQANACVDRATLGETRVKVGAKIDNLVQVGHGCTIGENTLLCSQVGIAGSTRVGNNVTLAGQVGVNSHISIGDGVVATGQSGITGDVPANSALSGTYAFDRRKWLRSYVLFQQLPEIVREMRRRPKES